MLMSAGNCVITYLPSGRSLYVHEKLSMSSFCLSVSSFYLIATDDNSVIRHFLVS